jgi:hypothetical protein
VNAACSGFTSVQELVLLAKDILRYEPDLIVEIGGGSDLVVAMNPEWKPGWHELYYLADSQITHPFWHHSLALSALHEYLPKPRAVRPPPAVLRPEVAEVYKLNVESMMLLTSPRRIPFLAVLHPILIQSTKKLTAEEKTILEQTSSSKEVSEGYVDVLRQHYQLASAALSRLKPPPKSYVMDATDVFAGVEVRAFSDRSHLTDAGYKLLAEAIGKKIEAERLLPPPSASSR